MKKAKRYSWCPKLGLGTLTEDCLGVHLQKGSTARWQGFNALLPTTPSTALHKVNQIQYAVQF